MKPLNDVRVRQAIAHALDRETIIQEIFLGQHQPARGILPAGMPGYNPQLKTLDYDPARARELLKKAGFPEGRGLPVIEIWSAAKSERIEKEMAAVKRQLGAVGIPAEMQYETNWPAFSRRLTDGRFSMFVYAWHADVPDPDNFLFKLFHSQSPRNLTGYANPIVDDLLFQARRERDVTRRIEIYRRAEQIIVDEVPVVPVWHYTYERLFQSYVRNVEVNGLGDAYCPIAQDVARGAAVSALRPARHRAGSPVSPDQVPRRHAARARADHDRCHRRGRAAPAQRHRGRGPAAG